MMKLASLSTILDRATIPDQLIGHGSNHRFKRSLCFPLADNSGHLRQRRLHRLDFEVSTVVERTNAASKKSLNTTCGMTDLAPPDHHQM
jgi:hypothetical protein